MEKQVDYVATEAAKDPKINYQKDWKVMTILMGANDLFNCESANAHPDVYIKRLNETIAKIDEKIPRIFINLFTLFEEGFIDTYNNGKDSLYCRAFWKVLESGIPCMVKSDALRSKMKGMIIEYNKRIEVLAKWWNQKRRKDFYIAVQPMLSHLRVLDRSWSSKFDCFHPSLKANKLISQSLWNSMQLPWDKKPRGTVDKILCPDQNTFLQ
jgi:phospholipase B1, membrane-associated